MKKLIFFIFITAFFLASLAYAQEFSPQFERAAALYKWKYYDESIAQLNIITDALTAEVKKEPYLSRAKFLKALCQLKKKDIKSATEKLQELIDSRYILADHAVYSLGKYYAEINNTDAALEFFHMLNAKYGNSALSGRSKLKEAECLCKMREYEEAKKIYKEYISADASDPNIDEAIYNLAVCYEKTGDMRNAVSEYNKILLYYPLSKNLERSKKRSKYLSQTYGLSSAAETDQTLFNKAMIFYRKQDLNSAALYLRQIVSWHKSSKLYDEALYTLAFCDYKQRRFSSAIARFNLCISRKSPFADGAQFYLSFVYGKRGYLNSALSSLKKVIDYYPNSSFKDDALHYLGYYYSTNGYEDDALKYYMELADNYPQSSFADDSLWQAGKIYYFKGDLDKAFDAFARAVNNDQAGNMTDRCAYWKALTLEKQGRKVDAALAYRYVIDRYDHTYYSHRARNKLNSFGISVSDFEYDQVKLADLEFGKEFYNTIEDNGYEEPEQAEPYPIEGEFQESNSPAIKDLKTYSGPADLEKHFKKYGELMATGLYDEARVEAEWLVSRSPDNKKEAAKLALSAANLGAGKYTESILLAEDMCNDSVINGNFRSLPRISWHLSYPKGYYEYVQKYSEKYGLDPYLVLALIREESRFNPRTLSWARAHGLMQLIPKTGLDLARLLRIKPYYQTRLYDPELNINLGCYYLSRLIKKFGGDMTLALAAYNGGPRNVQKWLNKWRSQYGGEIDVDEFVESIPLSETRSYVQKVLKSYNEYRRIYGEKTLTLTDFIYYHE